MDSITFQKSQSINNRQSSSLYPTRKSYNFSNMQRSIQMSQTDKRIQEIKRKYDTPNRKQRLSELSAKKSEYSNHLNKQNYGSTDFRTKSFVNAATSNNTDQALKQSKLNNIAKASIYSNNGSTKEQLLNSKVSMNYKQSMLGSKLYKNENEQEFFKRVKQMKQSLLYGNDKTSNTINVPSRHTQTLPFPRQSRSGLYQSVQPVQKDRIQNIDKINEKIKGILDCLNDNEKIRIPGKLGQDIQRRIRPEGEIKQQQEYQRNKESGTIVRSGKTIPGTLASSVLLTNNSRPTSTTLGSQYNHRYQKSQLLQKIEIPRQRSSAYRKDAQDQRWQKLSSKLQKYQLQNKLRFQKALQVSRTQQIQQKPSQTLVQSKLNQTKVHYPIYINEIKRSVVEPYEICKEGTQNLGLRRQTRAASTYNLRQDLKSRSNLGSKYGRHQRDRSLLDKDLGNPQGISKFDDEINKLQKKMQKLEEQKKKLNINFKPFSCSSNTKSTSILPSLGFRVERSITLGPEGLDKKPNFSQKKSEFPRLYSRNDILKSKQSDLIDKSSSFGKGDQLVSTFREQNVISSSNDPCWSPGGIQIRLQQSDSGSVRTSKFISSGSSLSNQQSYAVQHSTKQQLREQSRDQTEGSRLSTAAQTRFFDEQLKNETTNGIQARRQKLLQGHSQVDNQQLKILVAKLCIQVGLDEQFRNAKIWFEGSRKEDQLRRLLPRKSMQQIKQLMKVRQIENNPFFTSQGHEFTIQKVAQAYQKAQNHWNNEIIHKFDKTLLQAQGFSKKEIDIENKDFVNLGDLVRFLNLQSGTFYRNRDMALILIRIGKQYKRTEENMTEIKYQSILEMLCK